ncbi:MAG TPA: hypothetical protein PLF22_08530 [Pseudomonadales bacterium]|nr:hypothetical protein [Pseudomonadales bacterium]
MKIAHKFQLSTLPNDDKIYGVYWAGLAKLGLPNGDHPMFSIWLKEVDARGHFVSQALCKRIVQPAGFIPAFAIGSLWHKQEAYTVDDPKSRILTLNIKGQNNWCPVRISDRQGRGHHNYSWINPSDYRLALEEEGGTFTAGYKSWVVPMTTVDGRKVIVPCYELYRAFYAGSTELAWQLLTGPWPSICHNFIKNEYGCFESPNGGQKYCVIQPMSDIGSGAFHFIGMLAVSNWARRCADGVYANLLNDAQSNGSRFAWLKAVPPFQDKNFILKANVIYLPSTNSYLVTKIESASSPVSEYSLVRLANEYFSQDEDESDDGGEPPNDSGDAGGGTSVNVSGTRGRYPRRPSFIMSTGNKFFIDSKVDVIPYIRKPLPPGKTYGANDKDPMKQDSVDIGVGGKISDQKSKQGSFESSAPPSNVNRMVEIHSLVSRLVENTGGSFIELNLINPVLIGNHGFCQLDSGVGGVESEKWVGIYSDDTRRSRLVWVVQLNIAGRVLYWVEIEHARRSEKYCSLIFKTINGAAFDASLLREILNVCVVTCGKWPLNPPSVLAKKIVWKKARHISNGKGGLADNTLLLPLKSMGVILI